MPTRVFTTADTFTATAQVSHYGPKNLDAKPTWSLADERGQLIAKGEFPAISLETGKVTTVGEIKAPLNGVQAPARLVVTLDAAGTQNSWNIWVYPASQPPAPTNVRVVHEFDEATRKALAAGERVLLFSSQWRSDSTAARLHGSGFPAGQCHRPQPGEMPSTRQFHAHILEYAFVQPDRHPRHPVQPAHPALAQFPTKKRGDWQWADLLGGFSCAYSFQVAGAGMPYVNEIKRVAGEVNDRSKAIVLDEHRPISDPSCR
jgi:hypothetical protein